MIYMSFFIGLILICKGGDWFVDAASKLSEILGIPKYVIGATIVQQRCRKSLFLWRLR